MTGAVQTMWAELVAATLADAGIRTCVVSPGSRSTPLIAALAADGRLDLPTIIDERAAAFFALGVARATGTPAAVVCTSGSAAAHYFPAIVEASTAGIPLVVMTADRPPELQHCGATQTIDQVKLYGEFARAALDLGAPAASVLAFRAVRRKLVQAVTIARGPYPGPVHLQMPLRKPLEPAVPADAGERALAAVVAELRAQRVRIAPPRLCADAAALQELADAIASEPCGLVVAGALPADDRTTALRAHVLALCERAGYPLLAEAGSQLRFGERTEIAATEVAAIDAFDIVLGARGLSGAPLPRLIVQLGAEPVAAGWMSAQPALSGVPRWVLSGDGWRDPDSSAHAVVIGDVTSTVSALIDRLPAASGLAGRNERSFRDAWADAGRRGAGALERALRDHPSNEIIAIRAALVAAPPGTILQVGNSLPVRMIDHAATSDSAVRRVITQRGAAGIDGLIASAAGATRAGVPVLLVLGDVSFAHDVGGLLAARQARAPLAIVVIDNGGGQIFAGLPIARAGLGEAFERHFVTPPGLDPVAVTTALGTRATRATTPVAIGEAVAAALATPGPTIIHAPCTASGAHDVRRLAIELAANGGSHA
jgi:2-succinyl-5-enolpyruvyl-6-hydroxy-3-cyclohexene-1-carboxylate synthase